MSNTQPSTIYQTLFNDAVKKVGVKLFTVMVIDHVEQTAKRGFTSHPEDYPSSGSKPMHNNRWSAIVIDAKEMFVANTTAGFSDVFPDHELINKLGCGAVVNIPVLENDRVIGTVNFLHEENYFTDERINTLKLLISDYTPVLRKVMS